jgi:hypothetical protein
VEVQDSSLGYVHGSLRLTATKVEPPDRLAGCRAQGAEAEIESLVQRVNSASQSVIFGITVNTGPTTRFLFGTADNIMLGARIEVEGLIDQCGQLQARKVKFEDNDVRIQAQVNAGGVDVANRTLTLRAIPVRSLPTSERWRMNAAEPMAACRWPTSRMVTNWRSAASSASTGGSSPPS